METADVERWFGRYLDAFASCGRGEDDVASLLAFYGVPLLLTTEDGFVALTTETEVAAVAQRQVDGLRAADYDRSDVLELEISILNSCTAICRGRFARRRRDGHEIGRLAATYLVTGAAGGQRISALVLHRP